MYTSNRFVLLYGVITASLLLLSFRWPVNNGSVHSTFGEARSDHFHNGIDISSSDMQVFPVKEGRLVFAWDKSLFPLEEFPGAGNYSILEHDNNIKTVYIHLENNIELKETFSEGDRIAFMGNTGRSYGIHLHFAILKDGKISVNPLKLLPPIDDAKQPVIEGIFIKVNDRYTHLREGSNVRLTENHPLAIQCFDPIKGRERCGVYVLKVILNNVTVADYTFDSMILDDKNRLTINAKEFQNLYDHKGYYIIDTVTYLSGVNNVQIIAEDFDGNQTSKSISFNVVLDFQKH